MSGGIMKGDLKIRVIEEAEYIAKTGATVRQTGKIFHVGKSTVHKDMTERLEEFNKELYLVVKKILQTNLNERHFRGGEATRRKYLEAKKS